jgi:hypothetical protein
MKNLKFWSGQVRHTTTSLTTRQILCLGVRFRRLQQRWPPRSCNIVQVWTQRTQTMHKQQSGQEESNLQNRTRGRACNKHQSYQLLTWRLMIPTMHARYREAPFFGPCSNYEIILQITENGTWQANRHYLTKIQNKNTCTRYYLSET